MNCKKLFIFVFIVLSMILSPLLPADEVSRSIQDAEKYFNSGNYPEAIPIYQSILTKSSAPAQKAKALLRIGDIFHQWLNDSEKALAYYDEVKKRYPASPQAAAAYFKSGMVLYQSGLCTKARQQFEQYRREYPEADQRQAAEFIMENCREQYSEKKAALKLADGDIRVLLMSAAGIIRVSAPPAAEVATSAEKRRIEREIIVGISADGKCVMMDEEVCAQGDVIITPAGGEFLILNGSRYRGKLMIMVNPKKGLDVVNVLPLESYLYGVIPKEMPYQWFPEALKAQAIAARTYALYYKEKNRRLPYDITMTTECQLYGGMAAERESSNRAVDETRGIILTYKNRLVLAYFHAHSGGFTEDAARVWNADLPYLRSVQDEYSVKAPSHNWRMTYALTEVRRALNKAGGSFGPIKAVIPSESSPTGRVLKLKIIHGSNQTIMNACDFRLRMNPTSLKSTFFTIMQDGDEVTFEGRGYGHGVGMSQWGAYVMAEQGFTWPEILQYYYQDVDISKL